MSDRAKSESRGNSQSPDVEDVGESPVSESIGVEKAKAKSPDVKVSQL